MGNSESQYFKKHLFRLNSDNIPASYFGVSFFFQILSCITNLGLFSLHSSVILKIFHWEIHGGSTHTPTGTVYCYENRSVLRIFQSDQLLFTSSPIQKTQNSRMRVLLLQGFALKW